MLYISRSTISPDEARASVDNIVATATARNPELDVTGALLFTGTHFAQVLEGSDASIDRLMAGIMRDKRHEQVRVVSRDCILERRFPNWSLAYSGPSQFASRHVTRLLGEASPLIQRRSADWLNELMWEFSQGAGAA